MFLKACSSQPWFHMWLLLSHMSRKQTLLQKTCHAAQPDMQLPKSTQQLQLSSNYHACKTLSTSSRRKNHSSHKACLVVWPRYQLENFPSSRKLQRNLKIAVTTVKGQRPTKLLSCTKKTARLCRKLPDKVESIWSMRKTAWYPKTADIQEAMANAPLL